MEDLIHLSKNPYKRSLNVFLLLIPCLIFALIVAVLLSNYQKEQITTSVEAGK